MKRSFSILLALLFATSVSCKDEPNLAEGSFVVLLDSAPKGLDPRFATSDASAKIVGLLHAGLVGTDTRTGEPELELAESIEQPSPTTYEIRLKRGVTFHDGSPLSAKDVEFTLMELGSDIVKSPYAGTARRVKSFVIHDPHHFVIELNEPHAPFFTDLSMGIVSKRACAGHRECPGDPIGAGPFRYLDRQNDDVLLGAFDDYIGGRPEIDRLFFKVVQDDNTRMLALMGGSADLVQNAVAPLMLPVVHDSPRLEVSTDASFKYTYIAFNLRHEILDDVRVRQAIAMGIDRQSIVDYKFRGKARLATGTLSPAHWAYNGDVATYEHNVEEARRLLDLAGYEDPDGPDGPLPRFSLEFKVSSNKFRKAMAELIAHHLSDIGIEVTVRSYEWGTFFSDIKSGNFEMTTLQWPSVLEPSLYRWIFHSSNIPSPDRRSAGANRGAYRNERVDELLDRGNIETDRDERRRIYGEVQEILAEELPYVSLWHEDNIAILRKGVRDYYITPNARFEALKVTEPAARNE